MATTSAPTLTATATSRTSGEPMDAAAVLLERVNPPASSRDAHQPPPRWRWYAGCRPRAMILAISQRSL
jgi:hypothetical protein